VRRQCKASVASDSQSACAHRISSSAVRISLLVLTLFSDEFIMFTDHDHRYGDGSIVPGEFRGCVLNRSLNYQLAAVCRKADISSFN
jgi:hypothetical protein